MGRPIAVAAALVLLILSLPLLALLCLVSAICFRANPIFVQHRIGLGGRTFRFMKIRSLPLDTPIAADKHELRSVQVPAWGRFLRATHLDELPQLCHVITGKMNLVGPRPEMPSLAATFDPEFVERRNQVRPGVTGLWQVSIGVTGLIGDSPEYDLYYVGQRRFALDAWIIWRTALKIIGLGSLVTMDDVTARWSEHDQDDRADLEPVADAGMVPGGS